MNLYKYLMENFDGIVEFKKSFKTLTTIGCGGLIDYFVRPRNVLSLQKLFKDLNENNIRYFIIGNGSNTLAHDEDFKGVVISLKDIDKYFDITEDILTVSANYSTISLAYSLALLNKGDLSYLGGVPGTVGGAIYNNSGAYNKSIKNDLVSIRYVNTFGEVISLDADKLDLSYRHSIFHYINGVIIEAKFRVIEFPTKALLLDRKKRRYDTQPLNERSMGSIFKNPKHISAYMLVDKLGLRGYSIGDAKVSNKHANFIINVCKAKTNDIIRLIEIIKRKSNSEIGIELESEITIV